MAQLAALPAVGAATTKPNIILCMTDDQGWGDVSYNGLTKIKTPNIDAMAAAGLRFNRFYAQQTCSPTRASVMTGRHPNRIGVFWPGMPLRKQEVTIAQGRGRAGKGRGARRPGLVVFQSVRLKMLSGKAEPTRPADAKSSGGRSALPTSGGKATGESGIAGWTVRDCASFVEPCLKEEWGGRKNVFLTHPLNPNTPCVLTKKIAVPAVKKTTLHIVVANDPRGDFDFIVRADGKELIRKTVNVNSGAVNSNWLSEDVSLSAFAGKAVDVEILHQPTGWFYEQAYWAEITVSSQ